MCVQYFIDECSMLVLLCVSQINLLTLNVRIKGDQNILSSGERWPILILYFDYFC